MTKREDIIKSEEYWMETVQGEVFRLLNDYMEENNLNQTQVASQLNVSSAYISQILNGNFNYTIRKLISLSLSLGKVPLINFESFEKFMFAERYPDHTFRFTLNQNTDGGCLANVPLPNTNDWAIPNVKYSAKMSENSSFELIYR